MNTNIMKKGRIAMAWLIIVTMVFATMSSPFALASTEPIPTTPGVTIFGFEKVSEDDIEDISVGVDADYILFKQASVNQEAYYLWTKEEIPDSLKADIYAYLQFNDPSLANYPYSSLNFIWGYDGEAGTFNDSPYGITLSEDDMYIVIDWEMGGISHIDFGQYVFEDEDYDLSVTKAVTLNGDESTAAIDGTVYVSLFSDAEYTTMVPGTTPQMITIDNGVATTATFTVEETGTYYVAETDSLGDLITAGGMMFGYHLVSIENSHSDGVEVTVEDSDLVTITNNLEYHPEGNGAVEVDKVLTGPMDLEADMFDFTIVETDDEWAPMTGGYTETVSNDADGNIPFSEIKYDEAGVYYYLISEIIPTVPQEGITYDQHVVKVVMTVSDIGDGMLEGTPEYDGSTTFTNDSELTGSIVVTKEVVVLGEDPEATVNYTFYAALFEDVEGTMVKVSDVKELVIVDKVSTSVTFEGLELDKTYYVFETDADGNIIETDTEGKIVTPIIPAWIEISYENAVTTLSPRNLEGESTITNVFNTEGFPLFGSITVNKTVTVNGKAFASNRIFYVALFADEELTEMVSDVKPLKMNGNSSTTTEFLTDMDGNPLEAGMIYYIAETDKDGVPLTGTFEELGFEIDIDNTQIVITEEGTAVNIINNFKSEEFPLTGDDSNMNLWLFLAMLGVAGAIAPFAFRKKEVAND